MKEKEAKTSYVKVRMTREEAAWLREKSVNHSSVSHYIRCALAEYSDTDAKRRLELTDALAEFYKKFQSELSHIGGNLNQSAKRANELSAAGLLPPGYVREIQMPAILDTRNILYEIKRELETLTRKAVKP